MTRKIYTREFRECMNWLKENANFNEEIWNFEPKEDFTEEELKIFEKYMKMFEDNKKFKEKYGE